MTPLQLSQMKASGGINKLAAEHIEYQQGMIDKAAQCMKEMQEKIEILTCGLEESYRSGFEDATENNKCHKWAKFDHCEDIPVDEEVLTIDDCGDMFLDYVDVCGDTGGYYFANGADPTYYMLIEKPKQDDSNETSR